MVWIVVQYYLILITIKIKQKEIKVVGFSDTTAILLAIYQKTKIPTYYGHALLPSFDEQEYIKKWNSNSFKKYVVNNYVVKLISHNIEQIKK